MTEHAGGLAIPVYQKGCRFTVLIYGLFAAIAVQKNTRDAKLGDDQEGRGGTP